MADEHPTSIVRDPQTLLMRAVDALERNRIEEAVNLFRQVIQIEPESFHAHLGLGIALTKAYEISGAEQALETAIRLEPENFYPHLRMAELFQRIGVPTRAVEELQIALDLARTAEQRKFLRELLESERRRNRHRAWRPIFGRRRWRFSRDT